MNAFETLYDVKPVFWASIAGTLSRLATYAFLAAVSFYVLAITGRADLLALTLLSGTLPIMLISVVGGHFIDRYNRSFVILLSIVLRLIVMFLLFVGLVFAKNLNIVMIISLACALLSISDSITAIAFNSFVPEHVQLEDLDKVNGASTSIMELSRISGPFIGVFLFQFYGFNWVIVISAIAYTISTVSVFHIVHGIRIDKSNDLSDASGSLFLIVKKVFSNIKLVSLLLNGFFTHLSLFPFLMIGIPFLVVEVFTGQPTEFGIIEFAAALGTTSSGFFIAKFGGRTLGQKLFKSLLLLALIFTLYGALVIPSIFNLAADVTLFRVLILSVGSFLIFAFYGLYASYFGAVIQSSVELNELGRVFSIVITVNAFGRFTGFLLFGILFQHNWEFAVLAFISVAWLKVLVHIPFLNSEKLDADFTKRSVT